MWTRAKVKCLCTLPTNRSSDEGAWHSFGEKRQNNLFYPSNRAAFWISWAAAVTAAVEKTSHVD